MKALVYEEYAPDDDYKKILKVKDVPEPKPKSNEVVFKVIVAGLNHDD
ncbi:MAG TPA: Zn-dependent oxidoreductase, partial [Candidatus Nitrosotalea sp.]|nr:Zn-dependent oxidoreductase [Candidatus Nitrosotalea sp.]